MPRTLNALERDRGRAYAMAFTAAIVVVLGDPDARSVEPDWGA